MRLSDDTRFPHPVLSPFTGDFTSGEFNIDFRVEENRETGSLSLDYRISLTEPGIKSLLESNRAAVGCFIRCNDTYFTELRRLAWDSGRFDFPPGALLNRVLLRPIIWLTDPLTDWDPGTIHAEFAPPISLENGDIIAIGDESIISVGLAKLTPIESIFELDTSRDIPEGKIQVILDRNRIAILVAPNTYKMISLLRGQSAGAPVIMNAVYLPAIMEVLDAIRDAQDSYESRRWFKPFMARCDAKGITPGAGKSILEDAQALLENPIRTLDSILVGDVHGE
ncbi:hypothetical protein [Cupriavidus sp. UGS-1]|uniref:hypothetical protein n=1 Tax=Cupriavidus sp. UGS-1 TaxID=2899826 RepID=UPI001E3B7A51|nr:hypothetical protein [Cupriavidus sp. UGS-1]MCD9122285.1 hypothetical protein [Cupriavidus sp. UGS-1]